MSKPTAKTTGQKFVATARRTLSMFLPVLPVVASIVLLTGLVAVFLPLEQAAAWFGRNDLLDALVGATVGGIAAGHPLTGYVLGGELLSRGVSLVAVTALLVSWVTVGSIQLPAEALMLGRRFALYRNLISFVFAILIGLLAVTTVRVLGLDEPTGALHSRYPAVGHPQSLPTARDASARTPERP